MEVGFSITARYGPFYQKIWKKDGSANVCQVGNIILFIHQPVWKVPHSYVLKISKKCMKHQINGTIWTVANF